MKYISKYDNLTQFQNDLQQEHLNYPHVSSYTENSTAYVNFKRDYKDQFYTFSTTSRHTYPEKDNYNIPLKFTTNGSASIQLNNIDGISLSYSYDGENWQAFDNSILYINSTDTLYLRGENNTSFSTNTSSPKMFKIVSSDKVWCEGNVMSLLSQNATTLSNYCFNKLFYQCTPLVSAPKLPAKSLTPYCYQNMFYACINLEECPELPATTISNYAYDHMFSGCSKLQSTPKLNATQLGTSCYQYMFRDCTSLKYICELPAMTIPDKAYDHMFYGCSSITEAPSLNATNIGQYCYAAMFYNCTKLETGPLVLPAKQLKNYCYQYMFEGCTKLTNVPVLPALTVQEYSYNRMFYNCKSITRTCALPATKILAHGCEQMFMGCTSLEKSEPIMANNITTDSLLGIFQGCSSLDNIDVKYVKNIDHKLVNGDSNTNGYYVVNKDINNSCITSTKRHVIWDQKVDKYYRIYNDYMWECGPTGEHLPLRFTTDASAVLSFYNDDARIQQYGAPILYYSFDKINWTQWDFSPISFTSNDILYIKGDNLGISQQSTQKSMFVMSGGHIRCSGNIMSLLGDYKTIIGGSDHYTFAYLFANCQNLERADITLPQSGGTTYSFLSMFQGCTSLKETIKFEEIKTNGYGIFREMYRDCSSLEIAHDIIINELNAYSLYYTFANCTSLKTTPKITFVDCGVGAFRGTFSGCTSLTRIQELQFPEIINSNASYLCYEAFKNCTSLVTAPEINIKETQSVSTLGYMFQGCTKLEHVPDLHMAKCNGNYTFQSMFQGCTSLKYAPEFPVTELSGQSHFYQTFEGCTRLIKPPVLPNVISKTCYYRTFYGCSSLEYTPEFNATQLEDECYYAMFFNCINLRHACDLNAIECKINCYNDMFRGCSSLERAPRIAATQLAEKCFNEMFMQCSSLKEVEFIAETPVKYCYQNAFQNCTSLNYIKCLLSTNLDPDNLQVTNGWLANAKNNGTIVLNINSTWDSSLPRYSNIPDTMTVLYYNKATDKYYLSDKVTQCDKYGNII